MKYETMFWWKCFVFVKDKRYVQLSNRIRAYEKENRHENHAFPSPPPSKYVILILQMNINRLIVELFVETRRDQF